MRLTLEPRPAGRRRQFDDAAHATAADDAAAAADLLRVESRRT
jgi:hypothetical protein